jgi:hypothetical protein
MYLFSFGIAVFFIDLPQVDCQYSRTVWPGGSRLTGHLSRWRSLLPTHLKKIYTP